MFKTITKTLNVLTCNIQYVIPYNGDGSRTLCLTCPFTPIMRSTHLDIEYNILSCRSCMIQNS